MMEKLIYTSSCIIYYGKTKTNEVHDMTKVLISVNDRDYFIEDDASVRDILETIDATPTENYILDIKVEGCEWHPVVDHPDAPIPDGSIFRCMHKEGTLEV